ncbi:MAG: ceramide glucosyltransferase [Acidobacteriia bacterium 12-62-4]|nr:MAG: ceramide glucosyltransferase [Acidobacteriia bacterium 12-62-4]
MVAWVLAALLTGSLVYCVLIVVAVRRYRAARRAGTGTEPVSILKPLAGLDEGLEENLRSFFEQDYEDFELLFAVRTEADPAYALVEKLRAEYPAVATRTTLTGEPPWPNAKVWSLSLMMEQAQFDLLIMSDSDIRVTPAMARTIAGEFAADRGLAVTTCPYRAVAGRSIWSRLEAMGMNTEFWGGVLVARLLEGMRFAVGPTIAARKSAIRTVGGWELLQQYLAEDFVLGSFAADRGLGVGLSHYVIEHRIGSETFGQNAAHRIRWNRSTRRSRPAGYIGQVFTNPLPLALALVAARPEWWPVLFLVASFRSLAGWATAEAVLADPVCRRQWLWIPVQDLLSFAFWVAGFFGNTIKWRGVRYRLLPDGKFQRAE